MIKEEVELNTIGNILNTVVELFARVLGFMSCYVIFGPIMILDAMFSKNYNGGETLLLIFGIIVSCIGIFTLYCIIYEKNVHQWLEHNFGRKVKYEVPDDPTETNDNSFNKSSQYSYKNSSSNSCSDNSSYTGNETSASFAELSFSTSCGFYDYEDSLSPEMKQALKSLEKKGIDLVTLINKTDDERESLFIEEFSNNDTGRAVNEQFNYTNVYPARERHLETLINEAEVGEEHITNNLWKELKSFEGIISQYNFQHILDRIDFFEEEKRRKDSHIKYEGRLSNRDIRIIKEHLGYVCMGCGLDPVKEYGEPMKHILEAHHKIPFSELAEGENRTVTFDDFLILCPTCHKVIHKLSSPDDLDGLKKLLSKKSDR